MRPAGTFTNPRYHWGEGNVPSRSGGALANQPGPNGTRTIARFGISGIYTVNKDGSGIRNLTIALPGGGTSNVIEDFVITKRRSSTVSPLQLKSPTHKENQAR